MTTNAHFNKLNSNWLDGLKGRVSVGICHLFLLRLSAAFFQPVHQKPFRFLEYTSNFPFIKTYTSSSDYRKQS